MASRARTLANAGHVASITAANGCSPLHCLSLPRLLVCSTPPPRPHVAGVQQPP